LAIEKGLTVLNERGLHLSSAAQIAKESQKFNCSITLKNKDRMANAKSVLTITALFAPKGTILTVIADGPDEIEAVAALEVLFENRFGERQ
jgi:phosphocarrier protein HPr